MPRALTGAADLICNACLDRKRSYYWVAAGAYNADDYAFRFVGDGAFRESVGHGAFATVLFGYRNGKGRILGWWGLFHEVGKKAWAMEALAVDFALEVALNPRLLPRLENPAPADLIDLVDRAALPWTTVEGKGT